MDIFIFTLAVYGMSMAMVYFDGPYGLIIRFRELASRYMGSYSEVFSCMFCLPVNIGIIMSAIALVTGTYFTPFTKMFSDGGLWWLSIIMDGFYCGATSYFLNSIQERLEKRS